MITSKENSLIKLANQIKEKKYSRENKLCLVETIKLVSQLYLKKLITHILVIQEKYDLVKNYTNAKIEIISHNIAEYLTDTSTTDGVFGICKIDTTKNINYSKSLILDNIQDPANIGAIIRSACAFGYDTIFAINTVYPYSYKCIRSSMGYIFEVNYIDINYEELKKIKSENNIQIISADMDGEILDIMNKPTSNYAIVIGNEGRGISREITAISDKFVSIPMENNVESLNASVSASIIMYLLK